MMERKGREEEPLFFPLCLFPPVHLHVCVPFCRSLTLCPQLSLPLSLCLSLSSSCSLSFSSSLPSASPSLSVPLTVSLLFSLSLPLALLFISPLLRGHGHWTVNKLSWPLTDFKGTIRATKLVKSECIPYTAVILSFELGVYI